MEPVQFVWTSWAVVGIRLLVSRSPRNPWLWLTRLISLWDAAGRMIVGEVPLGQVHVQFVDSLLAIATLNPAFASNSAAIA